MYSFEEIVRGSPNHISHTEFERTPQMQRLYDAHKKDVLQKYASMDDYIFRKVFRCPCYSENDGKIRAIPPPEEPVLMVWMPNRFPYDLEQNIHHFLIWSNRALLKDEIISCILNNVSVKSKVYFFENPVQFRTIPKIHHLQVFVKDTSSP